MLSKTPSVPHLISEKIRLKSRIQSRNYLLGEFRQIVKRENERDSQRIAEIERKLNVGKPRTYKTFLFF
ncbi:MAG: hypothetical protein PF572_02400 [Patescibacteria group bacterium]|jgi:hypothetical protein|nr:hypothetical protein [Patescibacteria group bacterium]